MRAARSVEAHEQRARRAQGVGTRPLWRMVVRRQATPEPISLAHPSATISLWESPLCQVDLRRAVIAGRLRSTSKGRNRVFTRRTPVLVQGERFGQAKGAIQIL